MRSVSASQIETFDEETPFGCQVKWWLNTHMIPVQRTDPSLILGDAVHQTLEKYLKGGAQGELHDIVINANGALPFLEKLRPRVKLVEHWICEVEKVEKDGQWIEKPKDGGWSDLYLSGVPVHGKIDWIAEPAERYAQLPEVPLFKPQIELGDHKTSSNIARYGKTAQQVKHSPQMNLYAAALMGNDLIEQLFGVDPSSFIFTQDFYQTGKRGRKFEPVSISVLKPEIDQRILELESTVERMKLVEQKAKPDDVAPDTNKCDIGFGCPHRAYCPHYGAFNMSSLLDAFDAPATPAPGTPAPAAPSLIEEIGQEIVQTSSASQMSVAVETAAAAPKKRKLLINDVSEDSVPSILPTDGAPRQTAAPVVAADGNAAVIEEKPAPSPVTPEIATVEKPADPVPASAGEQPVKRGPGRPKGSKNKPKTPDAAQIAQQATEAAKPVTPATAPKAGEEPAKKTEPEIKETPAPAPAAPVKSDTAPVPQGVPGPTIKVTKIWMRHGAKVGMPNFSSATVEVEYEAEVLGGSVDQAKELVSLSVRKAMHDELEIYVKKAKEAAQQNPPKPA